MKPPSLHYSRTNKRPISIAAANERTTTEKGFWAQPWVTPIVTAILSALLSGLVVAYQLSNQHSFESRQKSEERQQKLIDEKVRLTGEAAKLSGQMLGIRRQLVLDKLALDLAEIRAEHSLESYTQQGEELAQRDFEGALNVVREDWIRLSSTVAEVQSVFKISSLHFNSKVQKAIDELGELGVIKPDFNSSVKSSREEAQSRFYAQAKAEDKYRDTVYAVIDAMASEVAGEFPSK